MIVRPRHRLQAAASNGLLYGLESYYKMDEASGTIVDAHGSADSVTETNITYSATGILNDALDFESSSAPFLSFGNVRDFSAWSGFSFSLWFNLESQPSGTAGTSNSYRYFYSTSFASALGEQAYIRYQIISGVYYLYFGSDILGLAHYSRTAITLSLSTWYHIVGSHDGTNWDIYLDGVLLTKTNTTTGGVIGSVVDEVIGSATVNAVKGRYMDGLINNFGIWSRALDSDDVTALHNSGAGRSYDDFTI